MTENEYTMHPTKWIRVEDGLPETSGKYLTLVKSETPYVLNYSAKRELFNAFDSLDEEFCYKVAIEVSHWMPLPELPKEDV